MRLAFHEVCVLLLRSLKGTQGSQPQCLIRDLGRCEDPSLCQDVCRGVFPTISSGASTVLGCMGNWAAKVQHCEACNFGTISWWSLQKVHQQQRFHFRGSRTGRGILSLLLVSLRRANDGHRSSRLWVGRFYGSSDPLCQVRLLQPRQSWQGWHGSILRWAPLQWHLPKFGVERIAHPIQTWFRYSFHGLWPFWRPFIQVFFPWTSCLPVLQRLCCTAQSGVPRHHGWVPGSDVPFVQGEGEREPRDNSMHELRAAFHVFHVQRQPQGCFSSARVPIMWAGWGLEIHWLKLVHSTKKRGRMQIHWCRQATGLKGWNQRIPVDWHLGTDKALEPSIIKILLTLKPEWWIWGMRNLRCTELRVVLFLPHSLRKVLPALALHVVVHVWPTACALKQKSESVQSVLHHSPGQNTTESCSYWAFFKSR